MISIAVYSCLTTDRRASKRHKILAHEVWPRADYWLWLDWPFRLTVAPERIVEGFETAQVVGFKHRFHDCAYAEHAMCARMQKDDIDVMRRQMDRYRLEKFPANFGMIECGILLRRNCPEVVEFNECWWAEVEAGSSRDQLSVGYAAWRAGVTFCSWAGTVFDNYFVRG